MGWIKTHRAGTSGIGKTLEDLLGITENNIPGPNAAMIELKSARKNATSMLTLFTKSPLPPKVNSFLLENYGYQSSKGGKRLETTVNAVDFNQLKGEFGFKLEIQENRINLITSRKEIVSYWDKENINDFF